MSPEAMSEMFYIILVSAVARGQGSWRFGVSGTLSIVVQGIGLVRKGRRVFRQRVLRETLEF